MRIYVGNLSFTSTEDSLAAAFGEHGQVDDVKIIADRDTGRSRGFGFVTMDHDDEARAAIEAMNGSQLDGRTINVNEARPRPERGGGCRGGGGGVGGDRW